MYIRPIQKRSALDSLPELGPGVLGIGAELLLNSQELVVLGESLGPAGGASLDLACAETNDKISDEAVLCLSRPVRHHSSPALGLSHVVSLDGLSHAADLVNLEQEPVAGLLLDSGRNSLWVGDQEVVSHDLDLCAGSQLGVPLPVILVKGILNTDNRVVLDETLVHLEQLIRCDPVLLLSLRVLEVQVVLAVFKELAGCDVHADHDLSLVTSLLDGLDHKLQGLAIVLEVGGEATLVTDSSGVKSVLLLDESLEVVVELRSHSHGLAEAGGSKGQHHELLHGELVAGVAAAVDNVEAGHRHHHVLHASEISNVAVKRNTLVGGSSLAHSHADAEDSVGAELGLVLSTVKGEHEAVNLLLLDGVHAFGHDLWSDEIVDVVDGLHDALAVPCVGLVPELEGLVDAGAGAGGHGRAEDAPLGGQVHLHSWVTAGVIDLASVDPLDRHSGDQGGDLFSCRSESSNIS